LVNYLDLGAGFFEFVADANPHKQGKYMPGQRISIRHPDQLVAEQPDYVLLLVWNFAGEVMRQQAAYRERGGSFIIPVPEPSIVGPGAPIDDTQFAISPTVLPARMATGSIGNSMPELAVDVAKSRATGDDDRVLPSRRAP
jgi:hypothetical protein